MLQLDALVFAPLPSFWRRVEKLVRHNWQRWMAQWGHSKALWSRVSQYTVPPKGQGLCTTGRWGRETEGYTYKVPRLEWHEPHLILVLELILLQLSE